MANEFIIDFLATFDVKGPAVNDDRFARLRAADFVKRNTEIIYRITGISLEPKSADEIDMLHVYAVSAVAYLNALKHQ